MRTISAIAVCLLISLCASAQTRAITKPTFAAGGISIFVDSLQKEQAGEFPSRWDLIGSGLVEIMEMDGGPVIGFVNAATIMPLMETKNYLPPHFTIELEAYFHNAGNEAITISMGNRKITTRFSLAGVNQDGTLNRTSKPRTTGWKQLSLSFNKRSLQVFMEEERLVNIPNIKVPPHSFSIKALSGNASKNKFTVIRNIRVMEGGLPLYDRLVTDGRFVTQRIQFESGKARLRPASKLALQEVALVLRDHPEVALIIEGHTDGEGTEANNQTLGQQRAAAVKAALMEEGIAGERLEVISYGEAQPIAENDTAEGRFLNRRVVFALKK